MNVALWLERAGKADPHRPAIGYGRRVVRTYAELAAGAARLAAAMRAKLGLAPGERVAVIAENCPEYVEILYGLWWAGLAAVPANAKLHGAELGYVLGHSGAKLCFAAPELEGDLGAHAPPTLERLIVIGSPAYAALLKDDPIASPVERRPDDLAWLFYTSGTTGRPKGAMLTHGNLASAAHAYVAEVDPVAPGDGLLHAAPMSHGSGLYIFPHVMRRGVNVVPESGGFDPEEIFELFAHWRRMSMFGAPTMIKRLVASPAVRDPHPRLGRRADVRRGYPRGARALGSGARPDLRAGREPDDDHDPVEGRRRRRRPSALARAPRVRGLALCLRRGRRGRCRPPRRGDGRRGRGDLPRPAGNGRVLEQPAGDGGDAQKRVAAHRRRRRVRRRWLPHPQGPFEGPHHLRRLEHLSARGRGGAAAAPGGARGLGHRPPRPRMGRGRRRLCGWRGPARGARRPVPGADRALQAAEGLRLPRGPAEEQLRQGVEDRASRPRSGP